MKTILDILYVLYSLAVALAFAWAFLWSFKELAALAAN